jgi:hypothetical protein
MPQNPLELSLTSLSSAPIHAFATVGSVSIPPLRPHLELLLHASRTEHPLVSDFRGRENRGVQDGAISTELRLHFAIPYLTMTRSRMLAPARAPK